MYFCDYLLFILTFGLYFGKSELLVLWRIAWVRSRLHLLEAVDAWGGLSVVDALQWEAEATSRNEEEKYKKMKEDWRLFWVSAKSGIRDMLRDRRQRRGTGKGRVG